MPSKPPTCLLVSVSASQSLVRTCQSLSNVRPKNLNASAAKPKLGVTFPVAFSTPPDSRQHNNTRRKSTQP
ncbi:hypothetical protein E2C01_027483 [Portunus trituberculatus]|uniref:Uncharacterized protein n=1 Tax=Portunus trituberculatus TaxID=210409 RepID=A0A5B7ENU2_PORTR|nr:hypothetical protein [Portunus trituberculatus]